MPTCPFLTLPQELRDLIFKYALTEDRISLEDGTACHDRRIKQLRTERWEWTVAYASNAPISASVSLMRCNQQLHLEMKEYLQNGDESSTSLAKLTTLMAYPSLVPTWTHIPAPPEKIDMLDILVKVDYMYHPALMSLGPHNAILTTIFEMLKRYIHRGPHLAKPTPLVQPLELKTVRITVAPPVPFEEMTYVYGWLAQQLKGLYDQFKALMRRFGRSGIVFGSIGAFELRLEGQDWERIPVTSFIWDEEDHTFFRHGGFKWDAGDE